MMDNDLQFMLLGCGYYELFATNVGDGELMLLGCGCGYYDLFAASNGDGAEKSILHVHRSQLNRTPRSIIAHQRFFLENISR